MIEIMKLLINGEIREVFIEYKKKKNISVYIDPEGFLTARVPKGISDIELEKILIKMKPSIERKLKKQDENRKVYEEGRFNDDEHFRLFGEDVTFQKYNLSKDENELRKFYYNELKKVLKEYLSFYEKKMRLKYKEFKITETKTTWGTCNSSKKLTFNLKLAMAPEDVIEYVVVHELAHLKHMNHDRSFWNLVGKYIPDYKNRQDYLKRYGQFMNI